MQTETMKKISDLMVPFSQKTENTERKIIIQSVDALLQSEVDPQYVRFLQLTTCNKSMLVEELSRYFLSLRETGENYLAKIFSAETICHFLESEIMFMRDYFSVGGLQETFDEIGYFLGLEIKLSYESEFKSYACFVKQIP